MTKSTCTINECTGAILARGWCRKHYRRWQTHGTPYYVTKFEKVAADTLEDDHIRCSKCRVVKSSSEYHARKDRGTLYRHCKDCHKDISQAWCDENTERLREARRRWKVSNPDLVRTQGRKDAGKRRALLMSVEYDPLVTIEALIERDGSACAYCENAVEYVGGFATRATVDHVIPVAQGGAHTFSNTVVACGPCNSAKNSRTPEQWLAGAKAFRGAKVS